MSHVMPLEAMSPSVSTMSMVKFMPPPDVISIVLSDLHADNSMVIGKRRARRMPIFLRCVR